MEWRYICRYCQIDLGKLNNGQVNESQLGFDQLTPEERKDIITSNINGDTQVRVVCETCQQTLEYNPDLLLETQLYH